MPYEDLLQTIIDEGLSLGASYVEARYHENRGYGIASRNGEIIGMAQTAKRGVGVRVIVNGALGFAATNMLDKRSGKKIVSEAVKKARVSSTIMRRPIRLSEAMLGKARYSVVSKVKPENVPMEEKIKLHTEIWGDLTKLSGDARVVSFFLSYSEGVEEKLLMTSDGAHVQSTVPRVEAMYNIVVFHPERGAIQRMEQFGGSGGYEWMERWDLPKKIVEEAKTLKRIVTFGRKPPAGKTLDVVLGSEVVGLMVHESCGHPSEADRILGREAAQAGKSFMKPGMIGERIGSDVVTVIDDPTVPGSYGFYLYDDEGVVAHPRYLYLNGVINEHLHNRWSSSVYGVRSNAAARAMDYRSEPIVRMSTTYFKPGDYEFEELIEDIKYGVYIKSYMEWNIDDRRWGQRYVGLEAYLIEGGELRYLVRNPAVEFTTKEVYSKIDAADKNLQFYAGTCGKGEPMQGVPVWMGGPNVRVRGLRLGVAPSAR